jgi:hypothetical protein
MINTKYYHEVSCLIILVSLVFIGCNSIFTTPIYKIIENPRNYNGKAVTISGEVVEIFSLFVIKYFIVKDKTGEIVVVTERPLPKKGANIKVKGTVKEAFSIGDEQLIVLMESD